MNIINKSIYFLMCILLVGCSVNTKEVNYEKISLGEDVYVNSYYISDGLYQIADEDGRIGYASLDKGVIIEPQYLLGTYFYDEVCMVADSNNKKMLINTEGDVVLDEIDGKAIEKTYDFYDGLTYVKCVNDPGSYLIDNSGNILLSPTENNYHYKPAGNGLVNVYNEYAGEFIKVVDTNGEDVAGIYKEIISIPDENIAFYRDEDTNSYGLLNLETLDEITQPKYSDFFGNIVNETIAVMTNDYENIILLDTKGKEKINLSEVYENMQMNKIPVFDESGIYGLNFNDGRESILINTDGEIVEETDFDYIDTFYEGKAVVIDNGKYGYIDTKGNVLVEPILEKASNFYNGESLVLKDGELYKLTCK